MTHSNASLAPSASPASVVEHKLSFCSRYALRGLVGLLTLRGPANSTDTDIHRRFVGAVADWVKDDPAGKAIWNTCNDDDSGALQVGDLALMRSFHESALQARMAAVDLAFVSFDLVRYAGDSCKHFDAVLIDTTPAAT